MIAAGFVCAVGVLAWWLNRGQHVVRDIRARRRKRAQNERYGKVGGERE